MMVYVVAVKSSHYEEYGGPDGTVEIPNAELLGVYETLAAAQASIPVYARVERWFLEPVVPMIDVIKMSHATRGWSSVPCEKYLIGEYSVKGGGE